MSRDGQIIAAYLVTVLLVIAAMICVLCEAFRVAPVLLALAIVAAGAMLAFACLPERKRQ